MKDLKIIDYGRVWTCENMDLLAPINWEGYKVLLSDGSTIVVDDMSTLCYEKANNEEVCDFYRSQNFIFVGDEVEVVKGRKIPVGTHKIVSGFFDFVVPGTYGHNQTEYVCFTDGTKTDIKNIKNVMCKQAGTSAKKFTVGYNLSGRI